MRKGLHDTDGSYDSLALLISERLLPERPIGGTYDARSNTFPIFSDERTYLVSVPGHEHRVHGDAGARVLIPWLKRVRSLLAVEPLYLGWWRDGHELVFDISIALNGDRAAILDTAASWGQKSVFHPLSEDVVYVPTKLERVA